MTNTGSRAGKTVVQLYVGDPVSSVFRPARELKGFEKVELQPGESKDVSFTLCKRAFAYWSTQLHDWYVESGDFTIEIGQSSRHIDVSAAVQLESTASLPRHYTMDSIVMDILADPRAAAVVQPLVNAIMNSLNPGDGQESEAAREAISEDMNLAMIQYMPLRGVLSFGGGVIDPAAIQAMLDSLNT